MSENDRIVLKAVLAEQKATKAPELSDNAYFEIFTAEHILKDFDLSYDEIQSGQVGAGGDGGIDSMYMAYTRNLPGSKEYRRHVCWHYSFLLQSLAAEV